MKNIIFATALLVAFSTASFATEKNADKSLLKELSATFKNSSQVYWMDKVAYKQACFTFKNQSASAFYDVDNNELIGFGIQFNKTDLPGVVTDAMQTKYSDWNFIDAMIFITPNGQISYFTQVQKNNKCVVLKITPAGNLNVFARMNIK